MDLGHTILLTPVARYLKLHRSCPVASPLQAAQSWNTRNLAFESTVIGKLTFRKFSVQPWRYFASPTVFAWIRTYCAIYRLENCCQKSHLKLSFRLCNFMRNMQFLSFLISYFKRDFWVLTSRASEWCAGCSSWVVTIFSEVLCTLKPTNLKKTIPKHVFIFKKPPFSSRGNLHVQKLKAASRN